MSLERNTDIVYYHSVLNKQPNLPHKRLKTLWSNLLTGKEEILSLMDKSVRYEIRRARRDGVETRFYNSHYLIENPSAVSELRLIYNHFLKTKNLKGRFNDNAVNACLKERGFYFSTALYKGQCYAYHGYVGNGKIARLLYSVSLFRGVDDTSIKAIIGRANRLLHYNDLLSFKKLGYLCYDWGGYSEKKNVENITKFKKSFGGTPVTVYDALVPCSVLGQIVLGVMNKLVGKIINNRNLTK